MPKADRVPVLVPREVYEKLKQYSQVTGASMTHAVNEAIEDFVETTASSRMEAYASPTQSATVLKDRLLVMSASGQA